MNTPTPSRKLTLDDIEDLRAYERHRPEMRERVIALKRLRRVHLGTIVTVLFENRDTVRYQIQEMARAERLMTDEAIAEELAAYNPLIPEAGQLCVSVFIELTSDEQLREWLPKLIGIERSIVLRFGGREVRAMPEEGHAAQLTRSDVTSAVHYLRFDFTPQDADAFSDADAVDLLCDHVAYREVSALTDATRAALTADLSN